MRVYKLERLARVHKALGDETRLRIINLLAHRKEMCVCDIECCLDVSQSKASRHLIYLKNAGLLEDRRDATWVYYRIAKKAPLVRIVVREIKKALSEEETARLDVERSHETARDASCSPIELAKEA